MRPLVSLVLVSVVAGSLIMGCDEPTPEPPKLTPSSGTGVPATTGSGMGGAGGATSSSSTSSSNGSSTSSTSSTSTGSSSGSTAGSASSTMCVPATCTPECSGFKVCVEVVPCDFQCSDGATGEPCADGTDCVAGLQCLNHICE